MNSKLITLELLVNNHPGVMMHVVSLFARRAFNLEGIACFPDQNGINSRIWLRVVDDQKLDQIIAQLEKLLDVIRVEREAVDHEAFVQMKCFFLET